MSYSAVPQAEYLVRDSCENEKAKAWLEQEGKERIKPIRIHR